MPSGLVLVLGLIRVLCCRYVELAALGVLQIEGVVAGDQATYRCTATNDARERRSNEAQLVVTSGQFYRMTNSRGGGRRREF